VLFRSGAAAPRPVSSGVLRDPKAVLDAMDRAYEQFRKDHPDIAEAEALAMWEAVGG